MTAEENKIKIIPLGGLGAIGNHLTVFEYKDEIIIVDAGIMFPDEDVPGVDFLIPDFTYLEKNKKKIKAIIITHGHEDHIGAVPFLLQKVNAPVYGTNLTLGFIQNKLDERPPKNDPKLIPISPRETVKTDAFTMEFIRINHSIVDGISVAITTDIGTIIHSGDFKIDYSPLDGQVIDLARFAEYGESGVLLLMSDSTNAMVKGYSRSESSLKEGLLDIFSSAKGRIIVASFASNIHRIQQVLDAAYKYNRKIALSGISIEKNFAIASDLGYLTYKKELIIDIKKTSGFPDKKIVVICTGSQGEPMSALSRMANATHKHIQISDKDTIVISASVIPGKEKTVSNVVDSLLKKGAEVYYDKEDIHATGHATEEELKLMITLTKPKFFMPIHGEYKHLKAHAKIAESLKIKTSRIMIAENGDILELNRNIFKKTDKLTLSKVFVEGSETGDIESEIIKDRQSMSTEGIIFITAIRTGTVLRDPLVITARGFIGFTNKKVLKSIKDTAATEIDKLLLDGMNDEELIITLKKKLKKHIFGLTRRSPIIEINIIEV
ncbi:MAG: ribonuclease J [Spirochaetes bacterium]|nr:ribonuclease J [Spirochaetota bacterium]